MSHTTITVAFYLSLFLILPLGLILMILWVIKIYKPLSKSVNISKGINLDEFSAKGVIFMLPGFILFVLFSIPTLYFNYLFSQEEHCKELIKVNNLNKTAPILQEQCSAFDINELFESVNK